MTARGKELGKAAAAELESQKLLVRVVRRRSTSTSRRRAIASDRSKRKKKNKLGWELGRERKDKSGLIMLGLLVCFFCYGLYCGSKDWFR